jgi:glycine reductase complex component B subunit gamma
VPSVLVTSIPSIALNIGANRIVVGRSITHPLGDPSLEKGDEVEVRERIVRHALELVATDVEEQTVVDPD